MIDDLVTLSLAKLDESSVHDPARDVLRGTRRRRDRPDGLKLGAPLGTNAR